MNSNIYVWDRFVRVFHWSLVALFIISYLTGESESSIHIYSGYTIAVLVIARTVWGVIGSRHARFTDFIYRPSVVLAYVKGLMAGEPKHYLGHNPLGGLMVIALLLMLSLTVISGMKLYAVEEGKGPLAYQPDIKAISLVPQAHADEDEHDEFERRDTANAYHAEEEGEDFWEEVHEAAVNGMVLLVILHIAGVVLASRLHDESLVKAMITGYKNRF